MGRLDELERCVHEGLTFTRERGFWSHAYNLEVHRCLLLLRRGDWDARRGGAARGCWRPSPTRGCCSPTARRGSAGCWRAAATRPRATLLADAWEQAQRQRLLLGLAYAGIARAEWAWLTGDVAAARQVARRAAAAHRAPGRGAVPRRAAALPRRAPGCAAEPFDGCPPGATPRACAATGARRPRRWRRAGDPYETALELARGRRRRVRGGAATRSSGSARRPAAELARDAPARARRAASRAARARPPAPTRPG